MSTKIDRSPVDVKRAPDHVRRPRPVNTTVLLRDAFFALNDLAIARLVASGHTELRPRTPQCSSTWMTTARP